MRHMRAGLARQDSICSGFVVTMLVKDLRLSAC